MDKQEIYYQVAHVQFAEQYRRVVPRAFFAGIPYEWHTNNDIARYEGYYASVFYSYFAALGYEIVVEESSAGGRLAVRTGGHV